MFGVPPLLSYDGAPGSALGGRAGAPPDQRPAGHGRRGAGAAVPAAAADAAVPTPQ